MGIEVVKLNPNEWSDISQGTMNYAFQDNSWTSKKNRIDYALIVQSNYDNTPYGFLTVIEMDSDEAYIQHGGSFPSVEGTALTCRAYAMMIDYLHERYATVSKRIWNRNLPMLKMAWKAGFIITGMEQHRNGSLYLFHELVGRA